MIPPMTPFLNGWTIPLKRKTRVQRDLLETRSNITIKKKIVNKLYITNPMEITLLRSDVTVNYKLWTGLLIIVWISVGIQLLYNLFIIRPNSVASFAFTATKVRTQKKIVFFPIFTSQIMHLFLPNFILYMCDNRKMLSQKCTLYINCTDTVQVYMIPDALKYTFF